MNTENEDPRWQRLSKALFGGKKTTDEGLFTYQVMERIRRLETDRAWPLFLRWAIPMLGVGMVGLVLAFRTTIPLAADEDPLTGVMEEF